MMMDEDDDDDSLQYSLDCLRGLSAAQTSPQGQGHINRVGNQHRLEGSDYTDKPVSFSKKRQKKRNKK